MSGKRRVVRGGKEDQPSLTTHHSPLVSFILAAMEVVLLALVCLSPWAYGVMHPGFEFLLDAGIAVLLALWAARILVEGQLTWKKSGVALCLAGLFLLGVWQRTPLPSPVLSWLSPGTERCYRQLLPEKPETLPDDTIQPSQGPRPGSTLSLYPGATRRDSLRLLAVFLVFAVVLNNLTSKRALTRLSVVALINGACLSLFAIAQFFGAPRSTVYWHYPAMGTVFGPFINRNHFPDYVNMCLGLGIGLLVVQVMRRRSASLDEENSLIQTLHNPRALWICAGLGLIVTAVVFSLSRGGLLALVGAAVLCGVLGRLKLGLSLRLGSLLLIVGVVLALSAWFGIGLIKDRLATLGSSDALDERVPIWLRSLRIVPEFPLWGTGYGTYGYIEPMYRKDEHAHERLLLYDHAHNDYLEMLVEGGVVGLILLLAVLAMVYRQGYRALNLNRGHSEAALALGALFAVTALALHSFGEFGAHVPAITLLATVIGAHVCALGQSKPHQAQNANLGDSDDYRLRLGGVAPVLGALTALGLGLVICASSWRDHRIDRLKDAAFRTSDTAADQLRKRISFLAAATSLDPGNAQIHIDLGKAQGQLAVQLAGGAFSKRPMAQEHWLLALQEFIRARDACPLSSEAQLGIAALASRLKQGDPVEDYLRRAKLLTPGQVKMCYLRGEKESALNRLEDAWATWRHCLELSDEYLPDILLRTRGLAPDKLVEKVLPDNPDLLLVAAVLRYPDSRAVDQRRPFMEKALRLIESKPEAIVSRNMNVDERTLKARIEFARYLYEHNKLDAARREVRLVLVQRPKDGQALDLLGAISRKRP